jgi:outer membrane protein OmpA-like peptidoglycan-associated protein
MNSVRLKLRAGALGVALVACGVTPAFAGGGTNGADQGSPQGGVGAISGLAVGAAAAGPIGAVVGMVAGAMIGDHYHRQQKSAAAIAADLDKSESERAQLASSVMQLDTSLAHAQEREAKLSETVQQASQIGLDVGFRTNDDCVPEQAMSPLLRVGALAAAMPDTVVRIAGYADPRGSDAYNDALSLRRAQGVAALLTSAGVPAGRIIIEQHGKTESQSEQGDLDGYALERRVTVRLEQPAVAQVASRD